MNDFALVLASLRSRWLGNLLSAALTGFGFMLALLVLLIGHHVQQRLIKDGQGIDLVIGAKGSPLQLVLSSIYHLDVPTGNIAYDDAQRWMKHPQVRQAIPLALGDNWRGYRIIGTTPDYLSLYGAQIGHGRMWSDDFEVVAGIKTGLTPRQEFAGAHGFAEGGHHHDAHHYRVVGVLKPTGTVLDRLILTSMNSVLELHGQKLHHGHEHDHTDHDEPHHESAAEPEVTALLIRTKSPLAQMNLPQLVNRESALQAANPAYEIARLTGVLGLGSRIVSGFSALMITLAVLSVFAGLTGNLTNRAGDLAILRTLGYGRLRLALMLIFEGGLIALGGLAAGAFFAWAGLFWLSSVSPALHESGMRFDPDAPGVLPVAAFIFIAGLCSAIIPAWRAAAADVSRQLSGS